VPFINQGLFGDMLLARGCWEVKGVGTMIPSVCQHLKKHWTDGHLECTCDIFKTRPALCHYGDDSTHFRFEGCTL